MSKRQLPPIREWLAKDPIGAVHIIHGLAEHPERYDQLATAMTQAGFTVWAHHQRGHGDNPEPGIKGHFADENGWRALIDDAWAVSKQLIDDTGLPVVMFAHSMGSFVGQGVLAEHGASYRAAIFSGTNGPPSPLEELGRTVAQWQLKVLGPQNPGLWLFNIVFGTFNAPFGLNAPPNTWLSRDPKEVDKYNHDCKCGFPLTSQAWLDLADGRLAQASVEFFQKYPRDLPIHVIAGTADPVGERGDGVRRLLDTLTKAGLSSVGSQFYPDARHELVHETNSSQVIADILAWLRPHFPSRGTTYAGTNSDVMPLSNETPNNTNPALRSVPEHFDRVLVKDPLDVSVKGDPKLDIVSSHVQGAVKKGPLHLLTHSNNGGESALLVCTDTALVRTIKLCEPPIDGQKLDHAGGFQRIGDYVVIPFEPMQGAPVSRVSFFDISDPMAPRELSSPPAIIRDDRKAGAAGIGNLMVDGRMQWYVAIVDNGQLEVLVSDGGVFPDTTFKHAFCDTLDQNDHQAFCLVADEAGMLYAIGFRSTGPFDLPKDDYADLYAIDVDARKVVFIETRRFRAKAMHGVHFRWGAGVDLGDGGTLSVLATGRNFKIVDFPLTEEEARLSPEVQSAELSLGKHCHVVTFDEPLEG